MGEQIDSLVAERRCHACGERNPARAKFCLECGLRLAPDGALRRTVSVVFADLVDSTGLQESLDVESARHVVDRFYRAMRGVVEAYGGEVEKFIGDAVVAVFGASAVSEDDALRAVRAADAMVRAVAELGEELDRRWSAHLRIRIGVNTGEIIIGEGGFVGGDTMNTAARLQQAAASDQILIAEATAKLVRKEVVLAPLQPLRLKGKVDLVSAHALSSIATPREQLDAPVALDAPLVGREAELEQMRAAFDDAVASGSCRLATLIGWPGIGKTRLARELADRVAAEAIVIEGRCEAGGRGRTFEPVAQVLRDAAGIGEEIGPQRARNKLAELVGDSPDREQIVEHAAGILGIVPQAQPEESFWSVRRLLEALAAERPVMVLLEDVHWGEASFFDLIEHLLEWAAAPILILALARPELREIRPGLVGTASAAGALVEISPLREIDARQLVSGLLRGAELPSEVAERVLGNAGGNPLFIAEMVRLLVEEGGLRREGEGWVLEAEDPGEIPSTVQALLAARVDRLPAGERAVVECASVIGHQFDRSSIAELVGPSGATMLDGHLEALRRKQMVEPDGALRAGSQPFSFAHVLVRDAAYRGLLKKTRADLHERLSNWLERTAASEGGPDELVAFHLEQALEHSRQLEPGGADVERLTERAVAKLHSAGRGALAREDLAAAANLLRRALAIAVPGPARLDVLIDLLEALLSAGETTSAETIVTELRASAPEDARAHGWASVAECSIANLTDTSHLAETVVRLDRAAGALASIGDLSGAGRACEVRAHSLALQGEFAAAEASLDEALGLARAAPDARRRRSVLAGIPRAALWGPAPVSRSVGRCLEVQRMLRLAEGSRYLEARALRCQAVLEAMRGRDQAARQMISVATASLQDLGLGYHERLETANDAATVELIGGRPETAERVLEDGMTQFGEGAIDTRTASAAALLARSVLAQGRDEEAEALIDLTEAVHGQEIKTTIACATVRAELLARRGEHAAAEAMARRAVHVAGDTDALADHADARIALATVLRMGGRAADSLQEASRALELYLEKGHTVGAAAAAGLMGTEPPRVLVEPDEASWPPLPSGTEAKHHAFQLFLQAINARDWEAARRTLADDVKLFDRRTASPLGDLDGPLAYLDSIRSLIAVADDASTRYETLAHRDGVFALRGGWFGHTEDGGAFERLMLLLAVERGDEVTHVEPFDPDDQSGLLIRLGELIPGAAIAAHCQLCSAWVTAWRAEDEASAAACCSEKAALVDRRAGAAATSAEGPGTVIDRLVGCGRWKLLRITGPDVALWGCDGGAGTFALTRARRGRFELVEWFENEADARLRAG